MISLYSVPVEAGLGELNGANVEVHIKVFFPNERVHFLSNHDPL